MPRKVITKSTLPKVLRELDRWKGKLTWPLFCARVAKVLGIKSVSRHTMYLHPTIVEQFRARQLHLRSAENARPRDLTLEVALRQIEELKAHANRLESTNKLLLDTFRRWQYNAFANGVPLEKLQWDKPLPDVTRSGRRKDSK